MKKECKIFIIILGVIFLFYSSLLYTNEVIVDLNGAGNYTSIQEGIDNSVNGDTVLVYPGIYYENINYNGKNITVASLYLTTQADSFIHKTIIDGNQTGSVVRFSNGEDSTAVLYGLTIVNGTGTIDLFNQLCGGGVFCKNSNPYITNCNIYNNNAYNGGGIFCRYADIILANNIIQNNDIGGGIYCTYSNITLSNNIIRYNHSIFGGGGICFTMYSEGSFDSEEKNSVYLNYAAQSNDIFGSSYCPLFEVLLDTATVTNNFKDFIYFNNDNQPIIDITHGKIEPINQNLFVSPDGNNANSGLTPNDPLKTISWALIKVASDSTNPNAIYLENGIYSDELTEEKFPLNMRSFVSLIGELKKSTILDANEKSTVITCGFGDCKFQINNLTLQNSVGFNSGSMDFFESTDVIVKNVTIKKSITEGGGGGIYCYEDSSLVFKNVNICNNTADIGGGAFISNSNPVFINCNISNNTGTDPYGGTGGIVCGGSNLLSCTLCNNNGQQYGAAYVTSGTKEFINVTVSDHSNPQGAIHVSNNQFLELINCILWDDGNEIYYGTGGQSYVEVSYTDIRNGENGIHTNGNGTYNWGDGNIDEDPLFVGGDPFSYELTKYSPCIDAGTPDTAGLHLPSTDLAGNQRIYNGRIDIGAYEYQDVGIDEPDTNFIHNLYLFKNTPNPFRESTTISFISADYERIKEYTLSIYNTKGQLVKRYEGNKDNFWVKTKIVWNGTDEQGRQVAPGTYFYKLEYNGHAVVRKMVLLR